MLLLLARRTNRLIDFVQRLLTRYRISDVLVGNRARGQVSYEREIHG